MLTEKFYTINFFEPIKLGSWNLIWGLGLILIITWLIVYLHSQQTGQTRSAFLIKAGWLLLLFWLPLALSYAVFFARLIGQSPGQSLTDKRSAKLCAVGTNQKIGDVTCQFYSVIAAVKEHEPVGSTWCLFGNTISNPFLIFGLYHDYDLPIDCQKADFILTYMTQEKVGYASDGRLTHTASDQNNLPVVTDLGRFAPPLSLGDGIYLLTRVK